MRSVTRSGGVAAMLSAVLLAGSFSIAGAAPPDGGGSSGTGDEFADLVVILRDEDGVPILKEFEVPSEIEGETEMQYCVQPISSVALPGGVSDVVNPVDGRTVYPIPLMGDPGAPPPPEGEEVEVCDPQPAYAVYVAEAELERLNMARQPDTVFQRKVNDVELKLLAGTDITLDGAGRITVDGVPIDASPEHAAMYRMLMTTGAIPGLGVEPAVVDPFNTWMLAAASMGTAAGKETPITVDSVQYYNRIATEIPDEYVSSAGWDLSFLSNDPNDPEQFVDFGEFDYTRSDVFQGCATWLDVPTLTWKVSPIMTMAAFDELPPVAVGGTVSNIAGFAQLADDVRKVIVLLHQNDVIPGFYIDPVGVNTCGDQTAALSDPAVNWDAVPTDIIQTEVVEVATSHYMPWDGAVVEHAQIRMTIDAVDDFTDAAQMTAVESGGTEPVNFTLDAGDLVGVWGPTADFAIDPGDVLETMFDVSVADGAPLGSYALTLELIDLDAAPPDDVLATDTATTMVHAAELTVLWTSMIDYTAQGESQPVTARIFNPEVGATVPGASLRMTIDAPTDFVLPSQVTAFSDAVQMPFELQAGNLVGSWTLVDPLPAPFDEAITWFVNIGEGSPTGIYQIRLELLDGTSAVRAGPAVGEFIVGYEAGAPVVSITEAPSVITNSTSATFAFESSVPTSNFQCKLDLGTWGSCASPTTYTGLADGTHTFAVSTTLGGTAIKTWTVDTVAPVIDLITAPPTTTTSTDATFEFSVTGAVSTLCSLDGAPLSACADPMSYADLEAGEHSFLLAAFDAAGNYASTTHPWTIAPFMSFVWPARLADTRPGWIAPDGMFVGTGPITGGSMVEVPVAGRAGIPADAVAVRANLTIAGAESNGYATAFGCGVQPPTSSVNYQPGRNAANEVMVELSATGTVCVFVSSTANVILDAVGYVPAGSDAHLITPARLEDTRPDPVAGGSMVEVPVAGRVGIPADAVAVMANLTIAGAESNGYATAFGCGVQPPTSSVNYQPGRNVANEVMVELSATGTVCVFVSSTANVILDAVGYVPAGSDAHLITPARLEDTRPDPVAGGSMVEVPVAGRVGIPADAVAVMANLTIAGAESNGYATAFGCGVQPPTSSVNYQPGRNVANEVMVELSATGTVCVFVSSTANVILDAVGSL